MGREDSLMSFQYSRWTLGGRRFRCGAGERAKRRAVQAAWASRGREAMPDLAAVDSKGRDSAVKAALRAAMVVGSGGAEVAAWAVGGC
jgi:hypothetical protein